MSDVLPMQGHEYESASVPSSPLRKEMNAATLEKKSSLDTKERNAKLQELREALISAKIPVSKRASVCEVPQSAADCQFVEGTTRCKLSLCEDSCTQPHQHHRTHAKPLPADAPLVYTRPSISRAAMSLPHSGMSSLGETPADSMEPSAANSPQQQYRRASTFGFGLGSHRGSMALSTFDLASQPPSPTSGTSTGASSAANSPRDKGHSALEYLLPVVPEQQPGVTEPAAAAPAPSSSSSAPSGAAPSSSSVPALSSSHPLSSSRSRPQSFLARQYWKLRDHIVNLRDYAPGDAGINTVESRSRKDLAPAPREDFMDQGDASWDPRSPQPPSPVEFDPDHMVASQLQAVNLNERDPSKPEIAYVLKPQ